MPDDRTVLAATRELLVALRGERDVAARLLQATKAVQAVLDDATASDAELNDAFKAQSHALGAARDTEVATQKARLRLQNIVSLDEWRMTELEHQLLKVTHGAERDKVRDVLAEIKAVVADYAMILERTEPITEVVEDKLRDGLRTVGKEARTMSQGRHVARAYTSESGPAAARFIDKRE